LTLAEERIVKLEKELAEKTEELETERDYFLREYSNNREK